jgi:VIT1/CCC1 family predicted Fe2+/Mn2+ transporter
VTGAARGRGPVLSPVERHGEILFGLIMVLSFTCTLSVAEGGRTEVRTMLIAALGCNLAWGIVDAVMYLIAVLAERGRRIALWHQVQRASNAAEANAIVRDGLAEEIAAVLQPGDVDRLREVIAARPLPGRPRLTLGDGRAAIAVLLLVFLSTFPVAVPFIVVTEPHRALRISNAVAIALLFIGGWRLARYAGFRPLVTGAAMVALGVMLVVVTIALGG